MIPSKPKRVHKVDWKGGEIRWANRYEQDPEGWAVSIPEHGQCIESDDARSCMRALMERAGISANQIPNWQDGLCAAYSPVTDGKLEIPPRTLYLSIRFSFRDKRVMTGHDTFGKFDITADDPVLKECAERLQRSEGIFRAWLIVRTRRFNPTLPKENGALGRFYAKPLQETVRVCRASFLPMDLV